MPTLATLSDWLTRPISTVTGATRAALRGEDVWAAAQSGLSGSTKTSVEDLLADAGMSEGWGRTAAGFVGDVAFDPLTYLPLTKIAKAIPGVSKGLAKVGAYAKSLPIVQDLGEKLVPYYGLPKAYSDPRRILASQHDFYRHSNQDLAVDLFKYLDPAGRQAASLAAAGEAVVTPRLAPAVKGMQDYMATLAERELAAGTISSVRPNYVAHMYDPLYGKNLLAPHRKGARELSAIDRFGKERTFDTFAEAQAAGLTPELDIAKVFAIRKTAGEKAMATKAFLEEVAKNPTLALPVEKAPIEWQQLGKVNVSSKDALKTILDTYVFEPKVAKDLNRLLEPGREIGALGAGYNALTNWGKAYATVANPGFHARNFTSNAYNAMLSGISPWKVPGQLARATASWISPEQGSRFIPKATLRAAEKLGATPADLARAAKEYGVVGFEYGAQGALGDSVEKRLERILATPKVAAQMGFEGPLRSLVNPLSSNNVYMQAMKGLGNRIENPARLAVFWDQIAKGKSLKEAALHANKWMINYAEKTGFEDKVLTKAFPFWTWPARNIPLQLESLVKTPGKPAALFKAYNALERKAGGPFLPDSLPQWMEEQGAVRLPWTSQEGSDVAMVPNLPIQDLMLLPNEVSGTELQRVMRNIAGRVNPIPKTIVELAANTDFFRNKPIVNVQNPDMPSADVNSAIQALVRMGVPVPGAGIFTTPKKGEQVMMDPTLAYLSRQLPFFEMLGKGGLAQMEAPGTPTDRLPMGFGVNAKPTSLNAFLGLKAVPVSGAKQTSNQLYEEKVRQRRARQLRRLMATQQELPINALQSLFEESF